MLKWVHLTKIRPYVTLAWSIRGASYERGIRGLSNRQDHIVVSPQHVKSWTKALWKYARLHSHLELISTVNLQFNCFYGCCICIRCSVVNWEEKTDHQVQQLAPALANLDTQKCVYNETKSNLRGHGGNDSEVFITQGLRFLISVAPQWGSL